MLTNPIYKWHRDNGEAVVWMPADRRDSLLRRNFGFTLLELLVVISIISLLIALLLPVLGRARDRSRLLSCVSNLRGQGQVLQAYTVDNEGSLPPRVLTNYITGYRYLINSTLASFSGAPFADMVDPVAPPKVTGIWRCPDAPSEMWTHSGNLFHAPNRWLFNGWISYDGENYEQFSSAPPGWDQFATDAWRKIDKVREPSEIIALMDNVEFFLPAHSHRESYESIGWSRDVVLDPPDEDSHLLKRGSHLVLFKRNAVFVDGHAETLPWEPSYWLDSPHTVIPPGQVGLTVEESPFQHRELERFMWMIGGIK